MEKFAEPSHSNMKERNQNEKFNQVVFLFHASVSATVILSILNQCSSLFCLFEGFLFSMYLISKNAFFCYRCRCCCQQFHLLIAYPSSYPFNSIAINERVTVFFFLFLFWFSVFCYVRWRIESTNEILFPICLLWITINNPYAGIHLMKSTIIYHRLIFTISNNCINRIRWGSLLCIYKNEKSLWTCRN